MLRSGKFQERRGVHVSTLFYSETNKFISRSDYPYGFIRITLLIFRYINPIKPD